MQYLVMAFSTVHNWALGLTTDFREVLAVGWF